VSLYTINAELSELLERGFEIDEETGELIEDIEDKLASLQMAEQDKLENIALYIKNLSAESAAIKAEEKSLAERRKAKEKRQESLKKYLADYLQNTDRSKFETPKVRLSFRKSEVVDYDDSFMRWALEQDRYLRYKEPDVDKAALKKAIKGGEEVPGATLLTKQNLQIK
jgi:uncharacterized protein (DUF3084 family)